MDETRTNQDPEAIELTAIHVRSIWREANKNFADSIEDVEYQGGGDDSFWAAHWRVALFLLTLSRIWLKGPEQGRRKINKKIKRLYSYIEQSELWMAYGHALDELPAGQAIDDSLDFLADQRRQRKEALFD